MVVPVAFVGRVAVTVVDVIDVVIVGHGDVPTTFAVGVVVPGVLEVGAGGALVEVPLVGRVQVPLVDIVDVVAVGDGDVAAAVTMYVSVPWVLEVGRGHERSSWECLMVSLTMWPTWASASW